MSDFDPVEWITTQEAATLTGYSAVTLYLRLASVKYVHQTANLRFDGRAVDFHL